MIASAGSTSPDMAVDARCRAIFALKTTGIAIFYTALTLAVGVGTWAFSWVQADMGVMLTFCSSSTLSPRSCSSRRYAAGCGRRRRTDRTAWGGFGFG
jgi:hypothetical protein